jgi:hypothetical protein
MKAHEVFSSSVSADERLASLRTYGIAQLWSVLYAERVQASVVKAARSRLRRLIKESRHLEITFEDHGQDFLVWTLDKKGMVIDSNAQGWVWVGGHVTDYRSLKPGVHPLYQSKDDETLLPLKYPVVEVRRYGAAS